jgi:2-methylisocitrate lyase-like PEP mutase family enzyme
LNAQVERAEAFAKLHVKGDPLILFNIWDAGSAKAVQEAGAKAIATGSWAVAAAHGHADREQLPFDLALANLQRIVNSVTLPVSLDMEGGYAKDPDGLKKTVTKVIEAGAVGINFEDQVIGGEGLFSIESQCGRIGAIRQVADQASVPLFINARTDIFLKFDAASHDDRALDEAMRRADAYAKAGASGFYPIGLKAPQLIERLCKLSPLPVNIFATPDAPAPKQLAQLGAARISYAGGPYRQVMRALTEAGRKALALE